MINSGWGADLTFVLDGLIRALTYNEPVKIEMTGKWQYAAGRYETDQEATRPVCPAADLSCYMLPLSPCADPQTLNPVPREQAKGGVGREFNEQCSLFHQNATLRWIMDYATRPQAWLRRRVVEKVSKVNLPTPCSVVHVRRSDVVLHGKQSRRYHAIKEYIEAASEQLTHDILLLTDDANAISEAESLHSQWNWIYLDRKRHKGAEGGWENQIPSKDPAVEVIALMTAIQLIKRCELMVYSRSGLATHFRAALTLANPKAKFVNLDEVQKFNKVFDRNNSLTASISKDYTSVGNQTKQEDST